MAIDHVSLRLQSHVLTASELAVLGGRSPDQTVERGTAVSSQRPDGPVHEVSTAVFVQPGDWQTLDEFVSALRPVIDAVATSAIGSSDATVDLVVAVTSRPLGFVVDLTAEALSLLSNIGCGIMIDVYSP